MKIKSSFLPYIILILQIKIIFSKDCEVSNSKKLEDCQKYCRITYKGEKNYYNQESEYCEIQAICDDGQIYKQNSNSCQTIGENEYDGETYDWDKEFNNDIIVDENYEIVCVKGTYVEINEDNKNDQCLCDEGYKDSGILEDNKLLKCDIEITQEDKDNNIDYGDQKQVDEYTKDLIQKEYDDSKILGIPQYYLELGAIILIFLLLIVICCLCRRRCKKKKDKQDESESESEEQEESESETEDEEIQQEKKKNKQKKSKKKTKKTKK